MILLTGPMRRLSLQRLARYEMVKKGGLQRKVLAAAAIPHFFQTKRMLTTRNEIPPLLVSIQTQLKAPSDLDNVSSLISLAESMRCQYMSISSSVASSDIHEGRVSILNFLATDLGPWEADIQATMAKYQQSKDTSLHLQRVHLIQAMRNALTPGYERLFQIILEGNAQEGMKFLVELRQDLLQYLQTQHVVGSVEDEALVRLKQLDNHLQMLLSSWFSPETLQIRRITYEGTSAAVIEKIATKEAVHPLQSLNDLKLRLGPDRRVFAAFHPLLPDEPLVFVHVALRTSIPTCMNDVLNPAERVDVKVAVFYSISSTQQGLSGIDLGYVLLKKAKVWLLEEFPSIETSITLSPIPRFRKWLQEKLSTMIHGGTFVDETLLSISDVTTLSQCLKCHPNEVAVRLLERLDDPQDILSLHAVEPVFMKLAANYLVQQKHRRKPLDGVARFHIRNGAEMYQLNYMADPSRKGLHNSLGIMVNYRYNSASVEENQAKYATGYHIPVCEGVQKWLASEVPLVSES